MQGSEHKPTDDSREKVRRWIASGVSQDRIAKALGFSDPKTVRKHYREEIDANEGSFNADFEASFLRRAMIERPEYNAIAIFAAKVRLGYRETVAIDPSKELPVNELTDDELRTITAEHVKRARSAGSGGTAPAKARAA